jgi:PEGA domain
MKNVILTIIVLVSMLISSAASPSAFNSTTYAQEKTPKSEVGQTSPPSGQPIKSALAFGLEDGTPVRLRITRTISSADARVDDKVDFEVLEEIKIGDVVVIPRGGIAWGTVTEAQPKRRMARGGKLSVNIDSVRLVSGEKVALRAVKEVKGGGHTGAMTGAIVATSIVFFPAAPFFLFMHGKDIVIPKGTEITAYINGDAALNPARFSLTVDAQPTSTELVPKSVGTELSIVVVKSNPTGADILVDGKFVGNTPSTLRLSSGEHTIAIEKSGFKIWQRAMTVSPGGNVVVDATLSEGAEPERKPPTAATSRGEQPPTIVDLKPQPRPSKPKPNHQ